LEVLLQYVSRGVCWDSDHVVTFTDGLQAILREAVRSQALERIHIRFDYFDACLNRVAAWMIGSRNTLRAVLLALLEPTEKLDEFEIERAFASRLGLQEDLKSMPSAAVWDAYCLHKEVPLGMNFTTEIKSYVKRELEGRG
jgi:L-rhamnose isomerase